MVIGPGDHAFLDLYKMVQVGFVPVPGLKGKGTEYSYIYVDDLLEGIVKALEMEAPGTFFLFVLPNGFSRVLVDRQQEVAALFLIWSAPLDCQITVQHRRRTVAELVFPLAQVGAFPKLLALEIVAVQACGTETGRAT